MQTILITGGTGFIGKRLAALLVERGNRVVILTRRTRPAEPGIRYARWDVENKYIDPSALSETTVIIHLAGAGVMDRRWTSAYKEDIRKSRVDTGQLLIESLKKLPNKVHTLISSSAIGWYGPDQPGARPFIESDPAFPGFLGDTCKAWENSVADAASMGIRLCYLRTGIVLGKNGGALEEFRKPLRFGLAAIMGSGQQIVSWIHIEDLCRMFIYLLENKTLQGPFNATAPEPVSNKTLVCTMAEIMRGKWFLPVNIPVFALKLALGESSIEILKSSTVSSALVISKGFQFQYPDIGSALKNLLKS